MKVGSAQRIGPHLLDFSGSVKHGSDCSQLCRLRSVAPLKRLWFDGSVV